MPPRYQLLLVFGVLSLAAPLIAAQRVRVNLPEWVTSVVCRVHVGDKVEYEGRGRDQTFACPASTEVVSCDFAAAEPLDVPLETVCRTHDLPVRKAQLLTVRQEERLAL